jgi:hypothetical protein
VIDTVGTKTDRPFAMLDLYGTPFTEKLHVVERYRLLSYQEAKEGLERDAKENFRPPVDIDRNYRGKSLQVQFTVEDEGAFTTPWTATITYRRGSGRWQEIICAENKHEYYNKKDSDVPTADQPDARAVPTGCSGTPALKTASCAAFDVPENRALRPTPRRFEQPRGSFRFLPRLLGAVAYPPTNESIAFAGEQHLGNTKAAGPATV